MGFAGNISVTTPVSAVGHLWLGPIHIGGSYPAGSLSSPSPPQPPACRAVNGSSSASLCRSLVVPGGRPSPADQEDGNLPLLLACLNRAFKPSVLIDVTKPVFPLICLQTLKSLDRKHSRSYLRPLCPHNTPFSPAAAAAAGESGSFGSWPGILALCLPLLGQRGGEQASPVCMPSTQQQLGCRRCVDSCWVPHLCAPCSPGPTSPSADSPCTRQTTRPSGWKSLRCHRSAYGFSCRSNRRRLRIRIQSVSLSLCAISSDS